MGNTAVGGEGSVSVYNEEKKREGYSEVARAGEGGRRGGPDS